MRLSNLNEHTHTLTFGEKLFSQCVSKSPHSHIEQAIKWKTKNTKKNNNEEINLPNVFGKLNTRITNYIIAIMMKIIINGS